MNTKKIVRRERAAARFNIFTRAKWVGDRSGIVTNTVEEYLAYVSRKCDEAKALGLKDQVKLATIILEA